MSADNNTAGMKYVPAIVIGGTATPKQRQRNFAFYTRIRDGVPGDYRQGGLKDFVFEVPVSDCSMGGVPSAFSFRLKPDSDCYRRLVSYIVGHTDSSSGADRRIEQLKALLIKACDVHDAINGNDAPGGLTLAERCAAARGFFDRVREDLANMDEQNEVRP